MLQKKYLPGGKAEVTFRMPPLDDVVELYLIGDFNDWRVNAVPLIQEPDGEWVATLVLDAGKTYRFRYYDNQGTWHNDWEADGYSPNDYGSDDSVLDLTAPRKEDAHPAPKTAARKAAAHVKAPKPTGGRAAKVKR